MDNQNISIENREKMIITEIVEMGDFNEEQVNVITSKGGLTISGNDLKVQKIDVDCGEVIILGKINAINYKDKLNKKEKGILEKIFK